MCSLSKEGEQEDVSLCSFYCANGEMCREQAPVLSKRYDAIYHRLRDDGNYGARFLNWRKHFKDV